MTILRPEQQGAVDWISKRKRACVVAPAGSGKTVIAAGALRKAIMAKARDRFPRIGWMANTLEQCEQARKALAGFLGKESAFIKVACAAADTDWRDRDALIVDECFSAGTMVSGFEIQNIIAGDTIESFCHETNWIQCKKVVRTSKRKPSALLKILISGRATICTPEHPFWTGKKYEKAKNLTGGSVVFRLTTNERTNLQAMCHSGGDNNEIPKRQNPSRSWSFLFKNLFRKISGGYFFSDNDQNKPKVLLRKDEEKQPNADTGNKGQGVYDASRYGTPTNNQRRERQTDNGAGNETSVRSWLDYFFRRYYKVTTSWNWIPDVLQNRRGESSNEDCNRGGWSQPQFQIDAIKGHKKGRVFRSERVESVEILKQTSDGTFGGMCPDGYVYNLEVADNHNYYADGILVHNCHHATAPQWLAQIQSVNGAVWGFTATPDTGDEDRDAQFKLLFPETYVIDRSSVAHTLSRATVKFLPDSDPGMRDTIERAIQLMTPRRASQLRYAAQCAKRPPPSDGEIFAQVAWQCCVEHGIVGNVRRNAAALAAALRHPEPTLILVNQVEHAKWFADRLPDSVACFAEMGKKKRAKAIDDFKSGRVQRLIGTSIFDEGFDVPMASVLVLVSGGKSRNKAEQRTGRVLRTYAGKSGAVIYDFLDDHHPLMRRHSQGRSQLYRELGYEIA